MAKLKFNIQASPQDLQEATKDEGNRGSKYAGPTVPDGLYDMKLKNVWSTENKKDGAAVFNAVFEIDEDESSENAVYNGAGIWNRLTIPMDSKDEHFDIQVRVINQFLLAVTNGSYGIENFRDDANAGRIVVGDDEKLGAPVESVGKVKFGGQKVKAKTKSRLYDGTTYYNIHFFDLTEANKAKASGGSTTSSSDKDVDDMLEGL